MNNKVLKVVENRKKFFIISISVILISWIIALIFGQDMSIEFKGGTILSYNYEGSLDKNDFEKTVEDVLNTDVTVKKGTNIDDDSDYYEISFTREGGLSVEEREELTKILTEKYADNKIVGGDNTNDVSPSIGRDFFIKSLVAVVFAAVLMIIYIALRFKKISGWSAGVMAVIALIHDCLIVFATFIIFRMEINVNFMVVVLFILGYSINDTIVIYDRLRENERIYSNKYSVADMVNLSITQCFTRSINTTVSTVLAMLVVTIVALICNVDSIISFSFPLMMGMISGVYSTICIACPLWVMWQEHKQKKAAHSYAKK